MRELPAEPSFAKRVRVSHTDDEDMLMAAGRERAGRAKANDVIDCFSAWYRQVRTEYGAETVEQRASASLQNCTGKPP